MQRDSDTDPISAKLQSEEAQLRKRIVLLTLIPLLAAVALIWITSTKVKELNTIQTGLNVATDSLHKANDALRTINAERIKQLEEIDSLKTLKDALYAELEKTNDRVAQRTQEEAIQTYAVSRTKPRVYLHILHKGQYDKAQQFQTQLENAGFSVPGIEVKLWRSNDSDLRVFRAEDLRTARHILSIAEANGVPLILRDLSARYAQSTDIRPGHFEIWFGRNFGR